MLKSIAQLTHQGRLLHVLDQYVVVPAVSRAAEFADQLGPGAYPGERALAGSQLAPPGAPQLVWSIHVSYICSKAGHLLADTLLRETCLIACQVSMRKSKWRPTEEALGPLLPRVIRGTRFRCP